MIDLYMDQTPHGLRASIALEETGLAYRPHKVDLASNEHLTPQFLSLNPSGAIPVLIDHNGPDGKSLTLTQSTAIVIYCAERTGTFMPHDPMRRARMFQWFMQVATDVTCASNWMFQYAARAPDRTEMNERWLESRLSRFFTVVDAHLRENEYLADEISIADLLLYPNYDFRKPILDKGSFVGLHRWAAALGARPGIRRGMTCLERRPMQP